MVYHEGTKGTKERALELSFLVVGAAIEVHRTLGPGLLESIYEAALGRELWLKGIQFERQVALPLEYKGLDLGLGVRMDLVVEGLVVVEVKSVERFAPIHTAQILTYLKAAKLPLGLLINFNTVVLRLGLRRVLNG